MIVLDIETSGLYPEKNGIIQIGALDLETKDEFMGSCRIDENDGVLNKGLFGKGGPSLSAVEVTGLTEEQMRSSDKQTQKQLLEKFFKWIEQRKSCNFVCQNPQFDIGFLDMKARKYGLKAPYHYRAFDLHTLAQLKFFELNGKFLFNETISNMGLSNALKLVGMEDKRKEHDALEDVKLEAECFSRLVYGKNMFSEFSKFDIPKEIAK